MTSDSNRQKPDIDLTHSTFFTIRLTQLWVFLVLLSSPCMILAENAPRVGRSMPASRFWKDVTPIGTIDYQGFPHEEYNDRVKFWYHLYRDAQSDWYLMGNGSGQLWKLDSNLVWRRIDRTFFAGYDFQSYLVYPGLKYGGYGIWRTNGMMFNYREKLGEWEIVGLSREIPTFGKSCFYDSHRHVMYQSGSVQINNALKENTLYIDSLFELDMHNREWKSTGALNPEALYFLRPNHGFQALERTDGKFLYSLTGDTCAMLDFFNKYCYVPNARARKAFKDLCSTLVNGNLLVSTRTSILLVDTANFNVLDSLTWNELLWNPELIWPMVKPEEKISGTSQVNTYWWGGFLALMLLGGGIYAFKKTRSKTSLQEGKLEDELPSEHVESPADDGSKAPGLQFQIEIEVDAILLNGKAIGTQMNSQEVRLLHILVQKKKLGQALNTVQFNELLGIDTRSPDNQKKIRSEVVKGINTAFQQAGFPQEAVRRIRHAEDRRMMMYFLHDSIDIGNVNE